MVSRASEIGQLYKDNLKNCFRNETGPDFTAVPHYYISVRALLSSKWSESTIFWIIIWLCEKSRQIFLYLFSPFKICLRLIMPNFGMMAHYFQTPGNGSGNVIWVTSSSSQLRDNFFISLIVFVTTLITVMFWVTSFQESFYLLKFCQLYLWPRARFSYCVSDFVITFKCYSADVSEL